MAMTFPALSIHLFGYIEKRAANKAGHTTDPMKMGGIVAVDTMDGRLFG